MKLQKVFSIIFVSLLLPLFTACHSKSDKNIKNFDVQTEDSIPKTYEFGIPNDSLTKTEFTIQNGDNLSSLFIRHGFSATQADTLSKSIATIIDPKRIKAGMNYYTFTHPNSPETIHYMAFPKSLTFYAVINTQSDSIYTYGYSKPIKTIKKYKEGIIRSSLWNEIIDSKTNPMLALKLSDVFAWQIDFFDIKEGDSFRILYEESFIDDTTSLEISTINGAMFKHQGKEYWAIPFTQDSIFEYFDAEGNSLRRAFLKAPLDFFRITSRFTNSRFHPVLKRYRAHHGVDYAAPIGTPVKSIGDGVVVAKGYQSGGGNFVKIKHNSTFTTSYMHLSKFAKGVDRNSHVQQGEIIGYVGSTGLSTGPHLDFRVYKNGQPINPLTLEAPPSLPVKPELKDSFMQVKTTVIAELNSFKHQSDSTKIICNDTINRIL